MEIQQLILVVLLFVSACTSQSLARVHATRTASLVRQGAVQAESKDEEAGDHAQSTYVVVPA